MMSIAVIIPVFNGGPHLERSLKAVVGSLRAPDELIVIDDSSTDGSSAVAERYGATMIRLQEGPVGPAVAQYRCVRGPIRSPLVC